MPHPFVHGPGSIGIAAAIAAILAAGAAVAAEAPAPAAGGLTALHCGHLIDTANGKMLGETTIVIEAGRIKDVASGTRRPRAPRPSTCRRKPACRV